MKTFEMNLMEDKTIIIKGETYEDLLGSERELWALEKELKELEEELENE